MTRRRSWHCASPRSPASCSWERPWPAASRGGDRNRRCRDRCQTRRCSPALRPARRMRPRHSSAATGARLRPRDHDRARSRHGRGRGAGDVRAGVAQRGHVRRAAGPRRHVAADDRPQRGDRRDAGAAAGATGPRDRRRQAPAGRRRGRRERPAGGARARRDALADCPSRSGAHCSWRPSRAGPHARSASSRTAGRDDQDANPGGRCGSCVIHWRPAMSCEELNGSRPRGRARHDRRGGARRGAASPRHVRRVPALVDQLTTVADELLMRAPVQEPPVGFESRVIDATRIPAAGAAPAGSGGACWRGWERRSQPPRSRRSPSWASTTTITSPPIAIAPRSSRPTASTSRPNPAGRDRRGGRRRVRVPGQPVVDARHRRPRPSRPGRGAPSSSRATSGRSGSRDSSSETDGSWGGAIPVNLYDLSAIRLLGDRPGQVLEASTSLK